MIDVSKKNELLSEIENTEGEACRLLKARQKGVEEAQYIKDVAKSAKKFISAVPEDKYLEQHEWDNNIRQWRHLNKNLGSDYYAHSSSGTLAADSTASTLIDLFSMDDNVRKLPPDNQKVAQQAATEIRLLVRVHPEKVIY